MISELIEIKSEGGIIQLFEDDDSRGLSIVDQGKLYNLYFEKFTKQELQIIIKHIENEVNKK